MSVTLAQVLLAGLILLVVVYIFALRSVSWDRVVMLVIAALGAVLVAWPGLSSDVARLVGIGRGADLILYLFILFCLFRFVSIAAGTRRLEDRLTQIVRESALRTARPAPRGPRDEAR